MLDVSNKILTSSWLIDIIKWFQKMGVEDLLELLRDVMEYVVIEERLMETLRKTWEDAKLMKLDTRSHKLGIEVALWHQNV